MKTFKTCTVSCIVVFLCSYCHVLSQPYFEWQSKVFTIDSLPNNISCNIFTRNIQRLDNKLIVPIAVLDRTSYMPYKPTYRKSFFYISKDGFSTCSRKNIDISPDTFFIMQNYIFNEKEGYALYQNVYTNGGYIFHKEFTSSNVLDSWNMKSDTVIRYIRFIDIHRKHMLRNNNNIIGTSYSYSSNGGRNWLEIDEPVVFQPAKQSDAYLIDSTFFYVHNYNFAQWSIRGTRFYRSNNKGTTWESLGCPVVGYEADSSNNIMFRDIRFQNSTDGIAIGSIAQTNGDSANVLTIFKTTNAGSSWYVVDSYKPEQEDIYMYIAPVQGDTIAAILNYGKVKISYDNGTTWRWLVRNEPMLYYNNRWNRHGNMGRVTFLDSKTAVGYFNETRYTKTFEIIRLVPEGTVDVDPEAPSKLNGSTIWIENMYPNPATKSITVETNVPFGTDAKSISIDIYDMLGSKVQHLSWSDVQVAPHVWGESWYNVTIPLHNLTNGVYVLRYKSNEYENCKTFIHVE